MLIWKRTMQRKVPDVHKERVTKAKPRHLETGARGER